jgi:hypothetical protein
MKTQVNTINSLNPKYNFHKFCKSIFFYLKTNSTKTNLLNSTPTELRNPLKTIHLDRLQLSKAFLPLALVLLRPPATQHKTAKREHQPTGSLLRSDTGGRQEIGQYSSANRH